MHGKNYGLLAKTYFYLAEMYDVVSADRSELLNIRPYVNLF